MAWPRYCLLALLALSVASCGGSSYPTLPIFFSGSGKTAPTKKAGRELPALHYWLDFTLPEVDPRRALALYHRMLPIAGQAGLGSRGIIMYGEGHTLQQGVTILSRAARVAARALQAHPWLSVTVFTTRQTFTAWAALQAQRGASTSYPFQSAIFFEDIQMPTLELPQPPSNVTLDPAAQSARQQEHQSKRFFQRKIAAMQLSPYERTLYMDPDTCVCGQPGELEHLFGEVLDEYDMAAATEHAGHEQDAPHVYAQLIPEKISERYWGLVLYRKTDTMMRLLDTIMELYVVASNRNLGHRNEQQAVREAIYLSKGELMEKMLNENRDLCRAKSARLQSAPSCPAKPQPLCRKCTLVQDFCECWSKPKASKGSKKNKATTPRDESSFPPLDLIA